MGKFADIKNKMHPQDQGHRRLEGQAETKMSCPPTKYKEDKSRCPSKPGGDQSKCEVEIISLLNSYHIE